MMVYIPASDRLAQVLGISRIDAIAYQLRKQPKQYDMVPQLAVPSGTPAEYVRQRLAG